MHFLSKEGQSPGVDTGGGHAGDASPTTPKEVLTWHLISGKIIAKNFFALHTT